MDEAEAKTLPLGEEVVDIVSLVLMEVDALSLPLEERVGNCDE